MPSKTDTYRTTRSVMNAAELTTHRVSASGRDYARSSDGYDDMAVANEQGWRAISSWGREGWDLGRWPYVVISTRRTGRPVVGNDHAEGRPFQMRQTIEGDTTVYAFATEADREAAIDYLFQWYAAGEPWSVCTWETRSQLDFGTVEVPAEWRGPFSWERLGN